MRLLHTRESDEKRQHFCLARIATWSFDDRDGLESAPKAPVNTRWKRFR